MSLKILSPKIHGFIDYAAASALIVVPLALNFGAVSALALWLSVGAGVGLISYSLITDYAPSLIKALPLRFHLAFDLAAAVAFLLAIPLLGFEGLVAGYYAVMALSVIAVVGLTAPEVESDAATAEVLTNV